MQDSKIESKEEAAASSSALAVATKDGDEVRKMHMVQLEYEFIFAAQSSVEC